MMSFVLQMMDCGEEEEEEDDEGEFLDLKWWILDLKWWILDLK